MTATDTGVGKTVLSSALAASMHAAGEPVRAHKPAVTGLEDPPQPDAQGILWPPDHELLAAAACMDPFEVAPLRFGPAVSPHLAAELAGAVIAPDRLLAAARAAGTGAASAIVEGVGGLLVPLTRDFTVCDLACELALPLLIAARPGLGTINHTLLTLGVARARALDVRAVVITPWPEEPGPLERSNLETITRLGHVEVATLERLRSPDPQELRRAGDTLPWRRWLAA